MVSISANEGSFSAPICKRCGASNAESAVYCGQCGKAQRTVKSTRKSSWEAAEGGYFAFRMMVSPLILRTLYVLGMLTLTCGGGYLVWSTFNPSIMPAQLAAMIAARGGGATSAARMLLGLGLLIPGNLLWRVLCEAAILFYCVHERLVAIEDQLKAQ